MENTTKHLTKDQIILLLNMHTMKETADTAELSHVLWNPAPEVLMYHNLDVLVSHGLAHPKGPQVVDFKDAITDKGVQLVEDIMSLYVTN